MNENEDDSDIDKTFKPYNIQDSPNTSSSITTSPTRKFEHENTAIEGFNVDNLSKYKRVKLNPSSSSKTAFTESPSSSSHSQQLGLPQVPIKPYEINNDQLQSNK